MTYARIGAVAVLASVLPPPTASRPHAERSPDTTYFVSSAGNDATGMANDATRPFRSPRRAYAAIPADITRDNGDHVIQIMDSGVYGQLTMSLKRTDSAHRIVLRAATGAAPTLDAHSKGDGSPGKSANNPALRVHASHVVVQGLRFNNTSIDTTIGRDFGGSEVMVRIDGSHVEILGNFFDGNHRVPTITDMFLLVCDTASENVVADNRFDFSGGKGLIYVGAGCTNRAPGRQTIRNNVLSRFGNKPQGVCAAINFGGATASRAGNGSEVANNTIHDNGGGCFGILNTNGSDIVVRNNILSRITGQRYAIGCTGSVAPSVNTAASRSVARNLLFFSNDRDVDPTCATKGWISEGHISADPMYADPGAMPPDLRLRCARGDFGAYGTASLSGRPCGT